MFSGFRKRSAEKCGRTKTAGNPGLCSPEWKIKRGGQMCVIATWASFKPNSMRSTVAFYVFKSSLWLCEEATEDNKTEGQLHHGNSGSLQDEQVHGEIILWTKLLYQKNGGRILEWVEIPFTRLLPRNWDHTLKGRYRISMVIDWLNNK